jgi:hypothetical protein
VLLRRPWNTVYKAWGGTEGSTARLRWGGRTKLRREATVPECGDLGRFTRERNSIERFNASYLAMTRAESRLLTRCGTRGNCAFSCKARCWFHGSESAAVWLGPSRFELAWVNDSQQRTYTDALTGEATRIHTQAVPSKRLNCTRGVQNEQATK